MLSASTPHLHYLYTFLGNKRIIRYCNGTFPFLIALIAKIFDKIKPYLYTRFTVI